MLMWPFTVLRIKTDFIGKRIDTFGEIESGSLKYDPSENYIENTFFFFFSFLLF